MNSLKNMTPAAALIGLASLVPAGHSIAQEISNDRQKSVVVQNKHNKNDNGSNEYRERGKLIHGQRKDLLSSELDTTSDAAIWGPTAWPGYDFSWGRFVSRPGEDSDKFCIGCWADVLESDRKPTNQPIETE